MASDKPECEQPVLRLHIPFGLGYRSPSSRSPRSVPT